MRINIIVASMLLGSFVAISQTRVEKKVAMKSNGYGVTYALPKTSLIVTAEVTKVTCKAGPYYKYAEKYLGVKDAVTNDHVYYELGKIYLENKGVPDEENTYTIEFKSKTVAPYVYLTEDGLMCSINADYTPAEANLKNTKHEAQTAETTDVTAVMTEELLMAGSVTRQAEVAAKQIYRLRESKMDIVSGEADNMPPDGEAMKLVLPQDDLNKEVLFRFSEKLGLLDADDLGGQPVYLSLHATERAPELDPKEAEKKEKMLKGIVYNVPGKAHVEIETGTKKLYQGEVQIVQFGTREGLAPVMFDDKKAPVKVFFYPETGAIKQIIQ